MDASTMELDELKQAWRELGRKLDRQHETQALHRRGEHGRRLHRGLRPLAWGQALQIAAGIALALAGGSAWVDGLHRPHLLIAGLVVHLYGIALIVAGAAVLALVARIDYTTPVLAIQQRLARLRMVYVRSGLVVGLAWWLLWLPLLELAVLRLAGIDLYLHAPQWFLVSGVVGAAGLLASGWGLRRWARGPGPARTARALDLALAGASLRRAQAALDEIARFERE